MFQLIVAVISIALVAALAIASIYYGGSAFSSSSLRANVVTLVNAGQQIAGAQALYKTDFGGSAPTMDALKASYGSQTYLSAEPGKSKVVKDGAAWALEPVTTAGEFASIELKTDGSAAVTCEEVVRQAGSNGVQFSCNTDKTKFLFKL